MRCTGSKTGAKGSYKPVQIPRFPLVTSNFINTNILVPYNQKMFEYILNRFSLQHAGYHLVYKVVMYHFYKEGDFFVKVFSLLQIPLQRAGYYLVLAHCWPHQRVVWVSVGD
jgi:hypothetical protein